MRKFAKYIAPAAVVAVSLVGGMAHAQEPTPTPAAPSYTVADFVSDGESKIYANLGTIMPAFGGIFLLMLGIGQAKKWITRGAKQG